MILIFANFSFFNNIKIDPRSRHYFLYGSPAYIIILLGLYWMIVMKWGPKFMENTDPFKLDRIIQVYNLVQIGANAYVFLKVNY